MDKALSRYRAKTKISRTVTHGRNRPLVVLEAFQKLANIVRGSHLQERLCKLVLSIRGSSSRQGTGGKGSAPRLFIISVLPGSVFCTSIAGGLCVWAERLEQGRLVSNWADVTSCEMDWTGLTLLLEGIEPKQVRKRYKKPVAGTRNEPVRSAETL